MKKILKTSLIILLAFTVIGCSSKQEPTNSPIANNQASSQKDFGNDFTESNIPNITIQFGNEGDPLLMRFENNQTALTIARNIGERGRNLPIYDFDNFENYEVMQYYDIPSSYNIPSTPQMITSQKAGEVYYSSPNRIILFYQDANIPGNIQK